MVRAHNKDLFERQAFYRCEKYPGLIVSSSDAVLTQKNACAVIDNAQERGFHSFGKAGVIRRGMEERHETQAPARAHECPRLFREHETWRGT